MSKFITLTAFDGVKVSINIARIETLIERGLHDEWKEGGRCEVYTATQFYLVKESREEILLALERIE